MLELVKAQKFPKAAGAEDTFIIDPHKLGETMYSEWGKYVDHANHVGMDVACSIIAICMGADQSLMPRKISFCVFQPDGLCTFSC